ncbi:response regulator [Nonomuraea sp. NPDC050556]|uniref:response regulator n=1 Tax=Nonomuraea sp. NPDC050556 TaxID=3364369 RepID=UPI00379B394D
MTQPIRVAVVDDQAVVREGLVLLLGLLPGIEVVGAAADGEAALALVADRRPDVVLMDLRMPRMDGVEATARIRADYPDTQVVVLTTHADDQSLFTALQAGARGYLTKSADSEEIARALTTVAGGQAQLDPTIQRRLLETLTPAPQTPPRATSDDPPRFSSGPTPPPAPTASSPRDTTALPAPLSATPTPGAPRSDAPPSSPPPPDDLTRRETEVLRLIANGLTNAEIATHLFISETTVKTHINNLFAKTHVRTRAQAVTYAYRHGLATPR